MQQLLSVLLAEKKRVERIFLDKQLGPAYFSELYL